MIAVSDTGPLLYLSLINCIELLPQLFDRVLIPPAVAHEVSHPSTPAVAARLIESRPDWLHICSVESDPASYPGLGPGEREAIALAVASPADVLLTDDAAARSVATRKLRIAVSGTIGVLYEAARSGRAQWTATDFDSAISRLRMTSFYSSQALERSISDLSRMLHGDRIKT
jgi:predicted nucleic acid-binding protein